jgi:hypothetical protein
MALWNRHFQDARRIRHAVSHAGEQLLTPEKRHRYDQSGRGFSHFSIGSEDTLTMPFEGKYYSIQVNGETSEKLQEILSAVHAAFPA